MGTCGCLRYKEEDMQYCNVKVPLKMACMYDANDIRDLLGALVGPIDDWEDATTGSAPDVPYEEGDVMYSLDGKWWSLAYDFMDIGDSMARVFRYAIDRQPEWDVQQGGKSLAQSARR